MTQLLQGANRFDTADLPRTPGRSGRPRRRWGIVAVVASVGLVFTIGALLAFAGGGGSRSTKGASGASRSGLPTSSPSVPAAALPSSAAANGRQAASSASGAPSASLGAVPALTTRVVKTGTVSLLVPAGHLQTAIDQLSSRAELLGGFVSATTVNQATAGQVPSGSVSLRVPVKSFEAVVSDAEGTGTATSVSISGQDVTASYVDLQARIASLQDTRTQFEQVLARATAIGDILSVETQIGDLQTQLEQLQGQLQVLDDQTTYSSLTVQVSERPAPGKSGPRPGKQSGLARAWDRARHSFAHGVEAVIGATGGIAVFLLFAGLVLALGRFAWLYGRRRWDLAAAPASPASRAGSAAAEPAEPPSP